MRAHEFTENVDEDLMGFLAKPEKKKSSTSSAEMRKYFEKEKSKEPPKVDTDTKQKPKQVFTRRDENFADGRHPEDKGDSKRHHVPTKSSVSSLRKFAKSHSGRAAQLAHWMANMKSGHKK
jgi:hypothetical protein